MTAMFDNKTIMSMNISSLSSPNGFVAIGPDRFGVASFDNLRITRADRMAVLPRNQRLEFLAKMEMEMKMKREKNTVYEEFIQRL